MKEGQNHIDYITGEETVPQMGSEVMFREDPVDVHSMQQSKEIDEQTSLKEYVDDIKAHKLTPAEEYIESKREVREGLLNFIARMDAKKAEAIEPDANNCVWLQDFVLQPQDVKLKTYLFKDKQWRPGKGKDSCGRGKVLGHLLEAESSMHC